MVGFKVYLANGLQERKGSCCA